MNSGSALPGTPREDADPESIKRDLQVLQQRVALLLPSRDSPLGKVRIEGHRKPKCFIIMPFHNSDLEVVYEDYVLPVLNDICQLDCRRGDDIFGSSAIIDDIVRCIQESDIAIADLTGQNANVFYEIGVCHTLGKPVLLLAQSKEDIPFDVRHLRVLLYDYNPRGCKRLERELKRHIDALFVTDI